jgi:DNA-binding NarL/FixJ family response regulator
VSDPVLAAQRNSEPTGASRLSTAAGSFWSRVEPPARPAGAPPRRADPSSLARFRARRNVASGLSSRERDVLTLLADGFSTREVARRLCYSERTIKNVVQEFTSRLQLRNRTQAVAYAVRRGWI